MGKKESQGTQNAEQQGAQVKRRRNYDKSMPGINFPTTSFRTC